ncbi:type II toxin-antitoxin system HicA family toxin [Pelagibacterium sediminicola]|uniref:type II toxin-antitoxin system HicA family toxin n=1 Tax=Pelagibacterium sediminicola TaxID=2248761 RepID=UPI000E31C76E|nr:type II toxin-antitoxin system HicA family toxin [Pelagibacterium sediminicola]
MDRLLERMRRNPKGDWTIEDVARLCRQYGAHCAPPRSGGSHYKVAHPAVTEILTVPFKRPIKPVYIRKLVLLVDAVRKLQ